MNGFIANLVDFITWKIRVSLLLGIQNTWSRCLVTGARDGDGVGVGAGVGEGVGDGVDESNGV